MVSGAFEGVFGLFKEVDLHDKGTKECIECLTLGVLHITK